MGTATEQSLRNILAELESDTLPTDAATETTLALCLTALQLIDDLRNALGSVNTDDLQVDVKTSALPTDAATQTTLALVRTELQSLLTELQLKADLTETQPVSAASLPLPSGAATSANQTTMITALQLIDDLRNALGSVNTDDLQVDVKTLPQPRIYEGDNGVWRVGAANTTTATETTLIDYTVTAGKTAYVIGWGVGINKAAQVFTGMLYIGATNVARNYATDVPVSGQGICFGKQTAGNHIYVKGWQGSGAFVWMDAWLAVVEI